LKLRQFGVEDRDALAAERRAQTAVLESPEIPLLGVLQTADPSANCSQLFLLARQVPVGVGEGSIDGIPDQSAIGEDAQHLVEDRLLESSRCQKFAVAVPATAKVPGEARVVVILGVAPVSSCPDVALAAFRAHHFAREHELGRVRGAQGEVRLSLVKQGLNGVEQVALYQRRVGCLVVAAAIEDLADIGAIA
jgi:hypothetical protein